MRRFLRGLAPLAALLAVWAFGVEPARLVTREHEIPLPGLPPALDGLRVLVLSDLHAGAPWIGRDKLRRIVERSNALTPDLVLLAGDYVAEGLLTRDIPPADIAAQLAALRAPLGVYAVLGNHDRWHAGADVHEAFTAAGLRILEDESLLLQHRGATLRLAGISDFYTAPHDWKRALSGAGTEPVIAFTHSPDLFPRLPPQFSLTVAGHTHGGQVWLPLLGRLVVPSGYGQRYAAGLVREDGRSLFVSTGIGTSILPVRFGVPPEISVLVLRSPP